MKNKIVIFDCDGTIVDTFYLIEQTVILTFKEMFPNYKMTKEEAHTFFGPYLPDTFRRYVKTEDEVKKCCDCYAKYTDLLSEKEIRTYDGVKELLEKLKQRGYMIAVASNKISEEVIRSTKICGIYEYIDYIVGAEMMKQAKPLPDCIEQIKKHFNCDKAILVGDMPTDILTGQNAKIPTCGVTWCQTNEDEFRKLNATYVINQPNELLKIVEEL